ncbi:MAG: recombination protein RecR [Phycisphaerales bacterium]|nr:recombination protein RecR [Phycisphaerales bacterium]
MARKPSNAAGKGNAFDPRPGYPDSVNRLLAGLAKLPGIGRRSAERLAFHILKQDKDEALALAKAIHDVKTTVRHCPVCFNFADDKLCAVCAEPRRDHAMVMVVEQPRDLIAIESTGMYRGLYHVLMGRLSPLEGVGPGDITIAQLMDRITKPKGNPGGIAINEVILALNPTLEGDGTALYLNETIGAKGVKVTRLARGLPAGGQLEFVTKAVLADAIEGRRLV